MSDPKGIRTPVTAVKGRCLNRLTMGPRIYFTLCFPTSACPQFCIQTAKTYILSKIKTPRVGLEPTTARLTAACSTD